MARARKVTEDAALQAAVSAFWRHGYQGLGTRQLEADTGITRFTLQTTYGGKMALFERVMDAYLDQMDATLILAMSTGTLEGLAQWFVGRCQSEGLPEQSSWGCLMIAAINEFAGSAPQVNIRADRFQNTIRGGFRAALDQIQAQGGLDRRIDKAAAAELLLASSIGLNVVVRQSGSNAAGMPMAFGIAAVIRGWAPTAD